MLDENLAGWLGPEPAAVLGCAVAEDSSNTYGRGIKALRNVVARAGFCF